MDIAEFVSRYPSKNTKQNYTRILKSFFEIVGVSQDSYFNDNRDYEKDIWTFFRYKNDKGYAPKTLNSDLGCIKTYLMYNEVEPKSFIWRDMRRLIGPTTMGKTVDAILKQSDLKTILSHTDVRGRALFLTLISSGMRVGEVNKVELKDVHLDEDPVRIIVRGRNTKGKMNRTVFISQEAKVAIQEWLKVRDAYLKTVTSENTKRIIKKPLNDDRLFPFETTPSRMMFMKAVEKAGLLEFDTSCKPLLEKLKIRGRSTIHIHSLRKYFRGQIGSVVTQDVAEALMGHLSGVVAVYTNFQESELGEIYKERIESRVSIFTNPGEMQKIREESQKQTEEIDKQRDSLSHMVAKNLTLEHKIGELATQSERISALERQLSHVTTLTKELLGNTERQHKEREDIVRLVGKAELDRLRKKDELEAWEEYKESHPGGWTILEDTNS